MTYHAIAPLSVVAALPSVFNCWLCALFFLFCYCCCVVQHMAKAARERVRERKSSQTQTAERKAFNTRCAVSFSKPNANKQMFVFLYVQRQQSTAERESAWESAQAIVKLSDARSLALALSLSTVPVSPHPLSKRAHLLRTFQAVSKVSPTELLRQRR